MDDGWMACLASLGSNSILSGSLSLQVDGIGIVDGRGAQELCLMVQHVHAL
jgi:hypothetical protein